MIEPVIARVELYFVTDFRHSQVTYEVYQGRYGDPAQRCVQQIQICKFSSLI